MDYVSGIFVKLLLAKCLFQSYNREQVNSASRKNKVA